MRVLLIEDEPTTAKAIELMLTTEGFNVYSTDLGEEGLDLGKLYDYDIILLDLNLPDMHGYDVLKKLRVAKVQTPVLILSGISEMDSKVRSFGFGADDYVTKPFNPRELLARIKAVLRRATAMPPVEAEAPGTCYRFGPWTFDPGAQVLSGPGGDPITLSTGESLLLGVFVRHPGRVLNRDQLLDLTRGRTAQLFDRAIDNQVSRLRKKVERDARNPEYIKTHWGGGYSFAAPVEVIRP